MFSLASLIDVSLLCLTTMLFLSSSALSLSHLPPQKTKKKVHRPPPTSYLINSNNPLPTERRPPSPRPPPLNLPLHLRDPKNPPPNLRLPRLRALVTSKRTPYTHRARPNHRRNFANLLRNPRPTASHIANRAPRPKPRHSRNSRCSTLLH